MAHYSLPFELRLLWLFYEYQKVFGGLNSYHRLRLDLTKLKL